LKEALGSVLTILTTALQITPILFVAMVPHSEDHLNHLITEATSKAGGAIFLLIVMLSIGYAIFVAVMNLIHPGWMNES